jgi:phosphoglycolate phosphatase
MHLLFDLDGTLTDPKLGILACIRHALAQLGVAINPQLNLEYCIGPPLRDSFRNLLGNQCDVEAAVTLYRQRFAAIGLYENRVYEGIPECLLQLRDSAWSIHLATSKPTIYADKIIRYFQLMHYFDGVYGSHLDGRLGDKTELLNHLLEREDLDPANCVMIGDRSFDMIGANNNAIRAVGVLWGYGSHEELRHAGAASLCETPADLHDLLFESG